MTRGPLLCHPDWSDLSRLAVKAEERDLHFRGPFLENVYGAGDGDRTRNQRLGKPLLYH